MSCELCNDTKKVKCHSCGDLRLESSEADECCVCLGNRYVTCPDCKRTGKQPEEEVMKPYRIYQCDRCESMCILKSLNDDNGNSWNASVLDGQLCSCSKWVEMGETNE